MNGVLRLTQNELSKIFHQMSWKILTLLLLLLSVGAPILSSIAGSNHIRLGYYQGNICSEAEEKAKSCAEGSVEKEYYLTLAEAYNYFIEQGFDKDSWQFYDKFDGYAGNLDSLRGCQLYLEGGDIMEIIEYFNIDGVDYYYENPNEKRVIYHGFLANQPSEEQTLPPELSPEETPQSESPSQRTANSIVWDNEAEERVEEVDFTPEIAKLIIKENEKVLGEIRESLKKSLEERVMAQMTVFEPYYEEAKKNYEAAGREYEKDKSKVQEYTAAKLVKESYDIFFETINRTDFSRFEKNAQKSYLSLLLQANALAKGSGEYAQMSERDFDENDGTYYMGTYFGDYSDYVRAMEQRQEQSFRALREYCYSLEHNVPMDSYEGGSVRSSVEDSLYVNIKVIMLMGIFMAAVIVASEHTSGAVRLLMIRPRARWKILLSKLFCVFIYMAGWIIATSVLSTVTNVIIYGGGDLFTPYIIVGSNGASEIAPLFYYIWKITVYHLPDLSMVCLAFLFSALIKRSVVAMAIPMLINVFGGSASMLFIGEPCRNFPPLKFTPIPYFNLSSFWGDPIVQLNAYRSPLDCGLTLGMGVVMFAVYSLLLLALAFVLFRRQQIKN